MVENVIGRLKEFFGALRFGSSTAKIRRTGLHRQHYSEYEIIEVDARELELTLLQSAFVANYAIAATSILANDGTNFLSGQYTVESNDGKLVLTFPSPRTYHLFVIMALVMSALMAPTLLDARVNASIKVAALVLLICAVVAFRWIYQPKETETVTVTDRSICI